MSWECETCDESHPGRFAFCPVSGKHRAWGLQNVKIEIIAEAGHLIAKGYDPETNAPLPPKDMAKYVMESLRITFGLNDERKPQN